jgi:hypothetical protein
VAVSRLTKALGDQAFSNSSASAAAVGLCLANDPAGGQALVTYLGGQAGLAVNPAAYVYALARTGSVSEANVTKDRFAALLVDSEIACMNSVIADRAKGDLPSSVCRLSGPKERSGDKRACKSPPLPE